MSETPVALWGGGFTEPMHPVLAELSVSLAQDLPLAAADLTASAAWARALGRAGVISAADMTALVDGLDAMRADFAAGRWIPAGAEDIHGAIEAELKRRVGEVAGRLHTGRSRNDQVATAFRLAAAARLEACRTTLRSLQSALVTRAADEIDTLLPAYTHVQRAQPVRLGHGLLAHFWALERDARRLGAAAASARDRMPLGSGAATGNPFGLDREALAVELGFAAPSENSLDAVSDRDFAVEALSAAALCGVHLSRLGEELVIWSSAEFGFVTWPDGLATGSSLMPNKKNPDLAELVRGRSAPLIGHLVTLLTLLKGLPPGYQRDLQEDKPPVWQALGILEVNLRALTAALLGITFERGRMAAALTDDILATEMADLLVARGVPFRTAHESVSRAAAQSRRTGQALRAALAETLAASLPAEEIAALVAALPTFEAAVERRTSTGGTARTAVAAQLAAARARLDGATVAAAGAAAAR